MNPKVVVIGGGPAGMQAALSLKSAGIEPVLIEKTGAVGGKLRQWHCLFPTSTPAAEVLGEFEGRLREAGVEVMLDTEVGGVDATGVELAAGGRIEADAVVIASGFEVFEAEQKEEYGYGIYENVFTTADIERMLNEGRVSLADGSAPRRIAFLHCVGSRDEKVNQKHCSKVCCITGVKQAMELKTIFPEADIFNFYMDIRIFGPGYEELYQQAQQDYNINFIRGRVSEASATFDGQIQIKAEDTLVGRPLKMTVDMLVLIVGMRAGESNASFARSGAVTLSSNGFIAPADPFHGGVSSSASGLFYAGAVTAPKNVGESMNEGAMAAMRVSEYLKSKGFGLGELKADAQ